ncbi:cytohesin-1 isoform X3, partial [Vespula maculifrons]
MWQDLDGLAGAGVHSGTHQVDQFGTAVADLTPEQQKILIDIRRKKSELLLEIQFAMAPKSYTVQARCKKKEESEACWTKQPWYPFSLFHIFQFKRKNIKKK